MPRVFDVFLLNDEVKLAQARIEYLSPIVDKFIVVEMMETYAGERKQELYAQRLNFPGVSFYQCSGPLPEYTHWSLGVNEVNGERFSRESWHRNMMASALEVAEPNPGDIILMSDVDEIPSISIIEYLKRDPRDVTFLPRHYRYYMNVYNQHEEWTRTSVATTWPLKMTPQEFRNERYRMNIAIGGWHFSTLDPDLGKKVRSFAHSEFDDPAIITQAIQNRYDLLDPFGRYAEPYRVQEIEQVGFPPLIKDPGQYKEWIYERTRNA